MAQGHSHMRGRAGHRKQGVAVCVFKVKRLPAPRHGTYIPDLPSISGPYPKWLRVAFSPGACQVPGLRSPLPGLICTSPGSLRLSVSALIRDSFLGLAHGAKRTPGKRDFACLSVSSSSVPCTQQEEGRAHGLERGLSSLLLPLLRGPTW